MEIQTAPTDAKISPVIKFRGKITAGQLQTQEIGRNVWIASPEAGVTKDDMLNPVYWGHVARKLRRNDKITALAADATWYAEFVVRASNALEALVGLTSFVEFDKVEAVNADEYEIAWKGPAAKWRITRLADRVVMKDGFSSKEGAAAWLALPIEERVAA